MVQITGAGGDMDKIGLFVDVQNIYYTTRDTYQRTFDYRSFWQRLSKTGDLVIATAYATSRGDIGQQKFQAALRHIGFNVRLKPFVQRSDGSAKGDWDVGITLDIIEHAPKLIGWCCCRGTVILICCLIRCVPFMGRRLRSMGWRL